MHNATHTTNYFTDFGGNLWRKNVVFASTLIIYRVSALLVLSYLAQSVLPGLGARSTGGLFFIYTASKRSFGLQGDGAFQARVEGEPVGNAKGELS